MKICDLSEILKFRNQHIIDRYCKDFNVTHEKANELFIDMLKFLWITKKNIFEKKLDSTLDAFIEMHHEMSDVDNMWHTFILFTQNYTDFCNKYFGHYLHHQPTTHEDQQPKKAEFEKQFSLFLNYVYDNLGEDTLRKWFSEYC